MDARSTVTRLGTYLRNHLDVLAIKHAGKITDIRGKGLMLGIQMDAPGAAVTLSDALLQLGIITLPAGNGDVLEITPPFVVQKAQLDFVVSAIDQTLTA
jgi:4-aminobutyrate aminotransferase-like enzyme